MSILVTGGAGFIGSHLAGRLLRGGHRVVVLDNFNDYYDPGAKRCNVAELQAGSAGGELEVVEGDLLDAGLLRELFAGERFELVHHLAAMAGVRASIERPDLYMRVNVQGTVNLLEAAVAGGRPPVVFASSSSVYGGSLKVPFREDARVDRPVSPYAASKKAAELICYTYHHLHRLDVSCLRFFTAYGPRQRPEMAIHRFARRLSAGRALPMFGDGGSSRDYTYVDDVVDGAVAAGEKTGGYRVYNIGNSEPVALSDLVARLGRALGVEPEIEWLPMQAGDVQQTWADIDRAREELGYRPKVNLDNGLRSFVEWFRARAAGT